MNSVESADKNYVIVSDGSEKLSPVPPLQRRLLTPFLSKEVPPIPVDEERVKYPYLMTNPFSTVFFTWLNPLLKVGYKRTLSPNDLFKIADKDALDYTYSTFERHLDEIIQKYRDALKLRDPSITEEELEAAGPFAEDDIQLRGGPQVAPGVIAALRYGLNQDPDELD